MGLIKSKSPVDAHAANSGGENSVTQDGSLEHRRGRRHRRRLPPTPSPWTSGEFVDSSPEDQVELKMTPAGLKRSKWSEVVREKMMGQRRSMLKKLVGRLSQKVNPEVDSVATKPPTHTELRGRCDHVSSGTSTGLATCSIDDPIYDANYCALPPVCYHQRDPRTTLTIYRSSLQSCVQTDPADDLTNNRDKPAENIYDNSNQVFVFTLRLISVYTCV